MASISLYLQWLAIVLHVIADHSGLVGGLYFTSEPQDVVGVKGSPLLLNCTAASRSGDAPVNITWLKDGQEVNDARRYVLRNGSLYFTKVVNRRSRGRADRSDEGHYECLARDRNGTISSRKAKLTCASITRISGVELSVVAIVGEVVRLQCLINAVPTPPTFTWLRDREPLPRNTGRFITLPSGALQIVGVLPSDAGRYRCSATNLAGSRNSKEYVLSLIHDPDEGDNSMRMLASAQQYLTRNIGENALFECAASGYPQPQISWSHNGDEIVPGGRVRIIGQGNLELSDLQLSDAGSYTCTAKSGDSLPLTMQASLKVSEKPELVEELEREQIMAVAQTVRLSCDFWGTPEPQISWLKNGKPITQNGRIKMTDSQELLIAQGDTRDSGYYQCRAENEAGMAQGTIHLYITPSPYAPSPPGNVRASPSGPNSIELQWDESPKKNGRKTFAYSVHYLPTEGGTEMQEVLEETWLVVDQLRPFTNYTFYVVAYNNESASSHSMSVTQVTEEDVPLAAPTITVEPYGATSLRVQWGLLNARDARGVITRYRVVYKKNGQGSRRKEIRATASREYIITGLESFTEYDVRVLAGTRVGYPDLDDLKWPWVRGTTHPVDHVPGAPVINVTATTTTSVDVTFRAAEGTPVGLVGFKLFIRKLEDGQRKMTTLSADTHQHTFNDLEENVWYELSVLAYNDEGEGEESRTLTVRTGDNDVIPPPPQSIDAKPVNDSTITVHWTKPAFGEAIQFYHVRYRPVKKDGGLALLTGTAGSDEELSVDTHAEDVMISGLKPFKLYEFDVRAHTSETTYGPYSSVVQCRTLEGRPSQPENVHVSLVSPGAVKLQWQEPREKNGVIVFYVVRYSTDKDHPSADWAVKRENGTEMASRVGDLEENVVYYFIVQAATKAGEGPATKVHEIQTQTSTAVESGANKVVPPTKKENKAQQIGIIVGVTIGGICIAVSLLIILLRNRCFPPQPPPESATEVPVRRYNGNGYLPNGNGNVYTPNSTLGSVRLSSEFHEMDSMQPMITRLNDSDHLDTKGGYDYIISPERNGVVAPVNGLRVNLKPNGQVPLRSSSLLNSSGPEEQQRLVQAAPLDDSHDSLDHIDRGSEHSGSSTDSTSTPSSYPNAQLNATNTASSIQQQQPSRTHQINSANSAHAHHRPTSHHTGSNNGEVDGECADHVNAVTVADSSIDNMQSSGDRVDRNSRSAVAISPADRHSVQQQQQPHSRHASSTSANSASQEHIRESGRAALAQQQQQRGAQEEFPSPSDASQSRSQGHGNELSATSLQNNSPPPSDQVTFSPTANHMHTNEQVLDRHV